MELQNLPEKMLEPGHVQGFIGKNSKICFGSTEKIVNDDMKEIAGFLEKSITGGSDEKILIVKSGLN